MTANVNIMIFVMSSIYGRKNKYKDMLKKLELRDEEDSLFVLGNIIGDGQDSIAILKDMMYRQNIFPVLGENEYIAKRILPNIKNAQDVDSCASLVEVENKELFSRFLKEGYYQFIEDFVKLGEEEKESIIDYLDEFEAFEEIEAGGKEFVMVHAGIDNFEPDKELDNYDEADFVFKKADYSKIYFKNKFLITSGTPTSDITGIKPEKVFSAKRHLAIDCGDRLAAVCLDKLKIYYC